MIYAYAYAERFEGDKASKIMQVTTAFLLVGYIMKQLIGLFFWLFLGNTE